MYNKIYINYSIQGHVVVAQQQQGSFWEGSGSGGGYSFW